MKNFKNSFGIKGSELNLRAFIEFVTSVGWIQGQLTPINLKLGLYFRGKDGILVPSHTPIIGSFCESTKCLSYDPLEVFVLPERWKEAMECASEVEETLEDKIDKLIIRETYNASNLIGYNRCKQDVISLLKEEKII